MALTPRAFAALCLTLVVVPAAPAFAQRPDRPWDGGAVEVLPYDEAEDWPDEDDELLPDLPVEVPATPAAPSAPATSFPFPREVEALPEVVVPKAKIIAGRTALVRSDGTAAIPRGAPKRVRQIIAAANQIIGKPYKWGGGHGRLVDSGYDCSGSVGYALIKTGFMSGSMVSGTMARWAAAGSGRWVSVYANKNHVYMEVAGLRFDTSSVGDPSGRSGVRWRPAIGRRTGFSARHPAGL